MKTSCLFVAVFWFLGGCAHTPGDAALRAGHPDVAAKMYREGVEQGDGRAALKLGLLIEEKKVKADDFGSPLKWYEKACALGSAPGCHNVGVAYEYGQGGVSKDVKQAYEFYLTAAEHGYMQSQYNLASLYSNQYVQNDVEGYKWMLLAQASAAQCKEVEMCRWVQEDPPGHRKKLKDRLSPEQLKEAERLAKSWKPKS